METCASSTEGWENTSIGEVYPKPKIKVKPDSKSTLPFIGMDHIEPNSFKLVGMDEFKNMRSAGSPFEQNDILYGRLRPYLNKVHIAKFAGVASAEFIVIPASENHDSDFLKYLLHQLRFVQFANENSSGDRPRLKYETMADFDFQLPPLAEQERIASKIDELFSAIEAGERAIERARKALGRYRKSILKAAVTGELTKDWREQNPPEETAEELLQRILKARYEAWEAAELAQLDAKNKPHPKTDKQWEKFRGRYKAPNNDKDDRLPNLPLEWLWTNLNSISWNSSYGTSTKCDYKFAGPAVLRIPNVRGMKINLIDLKFAKENENFSSKGYISKGDLIVIRTNGSGSIVGLGAVALSKPAKDCYFASYLIRFRICLSDDLGSWVNVYWQSSLVRNLVRGNAATSAGQYNISMSNMEKFGVPLPPLEEQAEIVSRVEEALSKADKAEATLDHQAAQAKALKQAVLKIAFEGKLVPQDPNDEPASELLKRIKAAT